MKLRSSLTFLLISTFTCVQHAHADLPLSGPDSWIEVKLRGHSENHVISRMTSAATANGMSCTHDGTGMPICGFEPGSYFAIQPAIGPKVVRFSFYYQSDDSPNIDPSRRHTIDLVVQEFVASLKDSRQVLRVVLCDAPSGRIGVLCSGKLLLDRIADDCDTVGYCSGGVGDDNIARACSVADNQRLIDESRVVSGDKGFCTRLMNSHWHYWPLAETHTVTEDEASEFLELRGSHTDIDPHAGFFDIDNDGKPEHLTRISSYSGAGQGCDVEEYVEMNAERTHLLPSTLTKLLEYKKCETYERAFLFDGKTYIENRRILSLKEVPSMLPLVLSEVWIIEGNKKRSVCNFSLLSSPKRTPSRELSHK